MSLRGEPGNADSSLSQPGHSIPFVAVATASVGSHLAVAHASMLAVGDGFVIEAVDGKFICREAAPQEARDMSDMSDLGSDLGLHVISPSRDGSVSQENAGLNIILRATQQLEGFPEAKAAFLAAAARWESLIQTAITIVVDVDFGPKHFGTLFDEGTIGVSSGSIIGNSYSEVLNALIASTPDNQKRASTMRYLGRSLRPQPEK